MHYKNPIEYLSKAYDSVSKLVRETVNSLRPNGLEYAIAGLPNNALHSGTNYEPIRLDHISFGINGHRLGEHPITLRNGTKSVSTSDPADGFKRRQDETFKQYAARVLGLNEDKVSKMMKQAKRK